MESMIGGTKDVRSEIATPRREFVFIHLHSNEAAITYCALRFLTAIRCARTYFASTRASTGIESARATVIGLAFLPLGAHPHILRLTCGFSLADKGADNVALRGSIPLYPSFNRIPGRQSDFFLPDPNAEFNQHCKAQRRSVTNDLAVSRRS
jgi:hypothetical protein